MPIDVANPHWWSTTSGTQNRRNRGVHSDQILTYLQVSLVSNRPRQGKSSRIVGFCPAARRIKPGSPNPAAVRADAPLEPPTTASMFGSASYACPGLADGLNWDQAEAQAEVPATRRAPAPIRRPAKLRGVEPTPAANHPEGGPIRPAGRLPQRHHTPRSHPHTTPTRCRAYQIVPKGLLCSGPPEP